MFGFATSVSCSLQTQCATVCQGFVSYAAGNNAFKSSRADLPIWENYKVLPVKARPVIVFVLPCALGRLMNISRIKTSNVCMFKPCLSRDCFFLILLEIDRTLIISGMKPSTSPFRRASKFRRAKWYGSNTMTSKT